MFRATSSKSSMQYMHIGFPSRISQGLHVWVEKGFLSGLDIKVVSLVMILGKCLVNKFYCHIWLIAPHKVTGTILSVI